MRTARLIISGTKEFYNYTILSKEVIQFMLDYAISSNHYDDFEIISGEVDRFHSLVEKFAAICGLQLVKFSPDYIQFGSTAEIVNNSLMVEYANHCICFWDDKCGSTKHLIGLANDKMMPTKVILI